jgi:hypothetical protein
LKKAASLVLRLGIIAAVAGFAVWVLGWMERDSCAKGGGLWLKASEECVCTHFLRGEYADTPTPEQIAHRMECELKPTVSDWIE